MKTKFKGRKKKKQFAEEVKSIAKAGFNPITVLKKKKTDSSARLFAERILSR